MVVTLRDMIKLNDYITFREASRLLGVSRKRVHVLCRTYGVRVDALTPRLSLICRKDLGKIPTAAERKANYGRRLADR